MITVEDYLENEDLLEIYYTNYQDKCTIVDEIIDVLKISDGDLFVIDYAQLQPIKDSIFIERITNIDMTTANAEGLLGFDVLKRERAYNDLILKISDEYIEFNNLLDLKIQSIREYNSVGRVMNDFRKDMNNLISIINKIDFEKLNGMIENQEE